ncbi:transcriptional repressor [Corynebacterium poyangense]|uniref:Transcriptional repressor n=1 Tax=Corynebacterium poyangense TaxID=2684405 RepID=A0A7H0SSF1_9CORY|nr:Fur family transcriptional regulator [Corynebacterium poyangense]MBZ8178434.1 transcriptional repressor [Corynebacterium poyangense]QNQ91476.1 transcriptional repressor [Corynebacterium poyangense]
MPVLGHNVPKLGTRNTWQRSAIIHVLQDLEKFSSAKDIYSELLKRDKKVGLTTVYRTLQSLAEVDAVDVLNISGGETLYRRCETDSHHHHLVCTKCGKAEEIAGGPVEKWAKSIAREFGYTLTGHDAEVYGLCPSCSSPSDLPKD